mgnify:CR=1 FL=1
MNRELQRDLADREEERFMRSEIDRRASADPVDVPNRGDIDDEEDAEDQASSSCNGHSPEYMAALAEVLASCPGEDSFVIACFGEPKTPKGKAIWEKHGSPER